MFIQENSSGPAGMPLFDLDKINKNMDAYMSSASKAYHRWVFYPHCNPSNPKFGTVTVDAVVQVSRLSLIASKALLVVA